MIPSLFVVDRCDRGRLRLTGRDRQTFLQGMVTNDVVRLAPGDGCYAFQLDPTAHILADLRILCGDAFLLCDVEPGQAGPIAQRLEEFLIMERCSIGDVTAETGQLLLGGADAPEALARLGAEAPESWAEGQNQPLTLGGIVCLAARTHLLPVPAYDLYFPIDGAAAVASAVGSFRLERRSDADLEPWRIAAGVPRFGVDLDPKVLAPESGQQDRAIHYRKGCYIGQEIVARVDARGHTNRGWAGFRLDALVESGAEVRVEGAVVGRITSCASVGGAALALGFVRHAASAPGTAVRVGEVGGVVAALPFEGVGV